jgi:four helix bundle protein
MTEAPSRNYKDLLVWQKAVALVKDVYVLTRRFPDDEKFGLTSQVRRSAVSVPSNMAEGQARQHKKEFRPFLHVALGSLAELDTQLTIAERLEYVASDDLDDLNARMIEIRKMTFGLLARLASSP